MAKVKVNLSQSGMEEIGQLAVDNYLKQLGDHCVYCGKPAKLPPDAPANAAPVCGECAKEHGLTPSGQGK